MASLWVQKSQRSRTPFKAIGVHVIHDTTRPDIVKGLAIEESEQNILILCLHLDICFQSLNASAVDNRVTNEVMAESAPGDMLSNSENESNLAANTIIELLSMIPFSSHSKEDPIYWFHSLGHRIRLCWREREVKNRSLMVYNIFILWLKEYGFCEELSFGYKLLNLLRHSWVPSIRWHREDMPALRTYWSTGYKWYKYVKSKYLENRYLILGKRVCGMESINCLRLWCH